jgi:hypothetical protein
MWESLLSLTFQFTQITLHLFQASGRYTNLPLSLPHFDEMHSNRVPQMNTVKELCLRPVERENLTVPDKRATDARPRDADFAPPRAIKMDFHPTLGRSARVLHMNEVS